ncbi:MAG: hypothetical protein U9N58_10205 [Thermodesulfobacteriota bacterium]|nr:hypothetical protein [Thermodesulfobacteriota bacterium]
MNIKSGCGIIFTSAINIGTYPMILTEVHAPQKIIAEYQVVDKRTNPFLTLQIDYTGENLF